MAMIPAFQLATPPAEPRSQSILIVNGLNPSTYTYWSVVIPPFNNTIRPPEQSVGFSL
jgi:hypothetical protein